MGSWGTQVVQDKGEYMTGRVVLTLSLAANIGLLLLVVTLHKRKDRLSLALYQSEAICLVLAQCAEAQTEPNLVNIVTAAGEKENLEQFGLNFFRDHATNEWDDRFDLAIRCKDGALLIIPSGPTFGWY
jgi:hypothetical protein